MLRQGNRLPTDYLAAAIPHQIVGTVHIEAERERSDQLGETRWLTELHAATGLPSAIVAHASFDAPDCAEMLLAHLESPLVRGIRSKPATAADPAGMRRGQPGSMQDEAWLRGFALLEKHGLSWDLRVPYWHLAEAAELARAFPGTAIVLNHTGLPWDRTPTGVAAWRGGLEQLAACPNVWIKISELGLPEGEWTVAGNRDVVRIAIDTFGIGRCMFDSNWPVSTLRASYTQTVDGLEEILQVEYSTHSHHHPTENSVTSAGARNNEDSLAPFHKFALPRSLPRNISAGNCGLGYPPDQGTRTGRATRGRRAWLAVCRLAAL